MNRIAILATVTLAGITALATLNVTYGGKTAIPETSQVQSEQIPDLLAYELMFRALSPDVKDPLGRREHSYTRAYHYSDAEAAAVLNASSEFHRRNTPLDQELETVVSHIPTPDQPGIAVTNTIKRIQAEKEKIVLEIVQLLEQQFKNYDSAKLRSHLSEVKRKTKYVQGDGTIEKISFSGFSNLFRAHAQGFCVPSVVVHADITYDTDSLQVWGSGSWAYAPNNTCFRTVVGYTELYKDGQECEFTSFNLNPSPDVILDGHFECVYKTYLDGRCIGGASASLDVGVSEAWYATPTPPGTYDCVYYLNCDPPYPSCYPGSSYTTKCTKPWVLVSTPWFKYPLLPVVCSNSKRIESWFEVKSGICRDRPVP